MAASVAPAIGGFSQAARAVDGASRIIGPIFTNPAIYTMALWWSPTTVAAAATNTYVFTLGDNAGGVECGLTGDHSNASYISAWYHRTAAAGFPAAKYTTTLSPGRFYLCVGTYDGTNISAYLDGKLDAVSGAAAAPNTSAVSRAAFGDPYMTETKTAFPGVGMEMALWRVALGPAVIWQMFQERNFYGIAPDALVDHWRVYRGGVVSLRNRQLATTNIEPVPSFFPIRTASRRRGWRLAAAVAPGESQVRGWGPLIAGQRSRLVRI